MKYPEAAKLVVERFRTEWPLVRPTIPFAFENDIAPTNDAGWVRVTFGEDDGVQSTLGPPGARRFRRTGIIYVQVFVPLNGGGLLGREVAEDARTIFEGVSIGTEPDRVNVYNSRLRPVGVDGRWWNVLVECFFEYFDTK